MLKEVHHFTHKYKFPVQRLVNISGSVTKFSHTLQVWMWLSHTNSTVPLCSVFGKVQGLVLGVSESWLGRLQELVTQMSGDISAVEGIYAIKLQC